MAAGFSMAAAFTYVRTTSSRVPMGMRLAPRVIPVTPPESMLARCRALFVARKPHRSAESKQQNPYDSPKYLFEKGWWKNRRGRHLYGVNGVRSSSRCQQISNCARILQMKRDPLDYYRIGVLASGVAEIRESVLRVERIFPIDHQVSDCELQVGHERREPEDAAIGGDVGDRVSLKVGVLG
eukprot:CAMPEP_0180041850 /NCGR_PEP_ID=MMETSP0984-20121128/34394_1 /TAXON_ID=483367 /ORGANISM="non described non described, Strain CCMP 2436" /LENGTH=181 /DNA_ID=CAMNT_0021969547 /DNA_START=1276 /DNA_END=1821 /DNA_ORIENTATION=+